MNNPALTVLRHDVDVLANLLAMLSDAAAHRGDADMHGSLQVAQRHVEHVVEGLEALTHTEAP